MIELLDYILDEDNNFWIIGNIDETGTYGYIVYQKDKEGNRYNNITKLMYTKKQCKKLSTIPKYKMLFKPRDCFKNRANEIPQVWKNYIQALKDVGIDDIGIFGSFLIGFDVIKDVDFIIYGYDNFIKYKNSIEYIRASIDATSITDEHVELQYNKNKNNYSDKCDLKKIIARNWSGVELKNGVLSTPRFIDNNFMIPIKKGIDDIKTVEIIDDTYTDFLPRRATALVDGIRFEILSTLWKYQSFARNNDKMEISGNFDYERKLIILDDMKYYIKYIN